MRVVALFLAGAAWWAAGAFAAGSAAAFDLPLRIDSQRTLADQFGYAPDYPVNTPSFDAQNRPFIRSRTSSQHVTGSVYRYADSGWMSASIIGAIRRVQPRFTCTINGGGHVSERVEIDAQGRAYTLVEVRVYGGNRYNMLCYSLDGCRTWGAVTLPFGGKPIIFDGRDSGTAALEQYTGWNVLATPPLVAVWKPLEDRPGNYSSRNALYVLRPYFSSGKLYLRKPTLVSTWFIGQCYAAGGASFAASSDSASYLVWPEVSRNGQAGVPTWVATYDRATREITDQRLVALARPRRDAHDAPAICRDSEGYLDVVVGAHHEPFLLLRSLRPDDTADWTAPLQFLISGFLPEYGPPEQGKQTYASLACLPDHSLVVVFRQARRAVDEEFAGAYYDALSVQRREPDGTWGDAVRLVMCADRPGYANYFQKLSMDRLGRLYLSVSYYNPLDYPPENRAANLYRRRMLLISKDGGRTWDFATSADFAEGVTEWQQQTADTPPAADTPL